MEKQTFILNPEKVFRQFREGDTAYVIQMAPDNGWVTDFINVESGLYHVYKRSHSYKVLQTMPNGAGFSRESCIMGNGVNVLNEIFQSSRPTIFNFMGRPGAGKGTHGGHFADIYGLQVVHIGALIRESGAVGATINELANMFVDSGIQDNPCKSICLDGYPRNFDQKDHLLSYVADYNIFTVFLNAEKQECMQRMEHRHDNSHTTDQDPEVNERRMEKYGKYTRKVIKCLQEASRSVLPIYYAEIFIESGAGKEANFRRVMDGMAKAVQNKNSWLQNYHNNLQK